MARHAGGEDHEADHNPQRSGGEGVAEIDQDEFAETQDVELKPRMARRLAPVGEPEGEHDYDRGNGPNKGQGWRSAPAESAAKVSRGSR
jgi:hypothetical protein